MHDAAKAMTDRPSHTKTLSATARGCATNRAPPTMAPMSRKGAAQRSIPRPFAIHHGGGRSRTTSSGRVGRAVAVATKVPFFGLGEIGAPLVRIRRGRERCGPQRDREHDPETAHPASLARCPGLLRDRGG